MANSSESRTQALLNDVFSSELYKRNQGKRARQLTAAAIGAFSFWGLMVMAERMKASAMDETPWVQWLAHTIRLTPDALADLIAYGLPFLLMFAAGWGVFRLVNYPRFADFLIATEAEMAKVSWASKQELIRSTIVVLSSMLLLAVFLFVVDWAWVNLMQLIGVLRSPDELETAWLTAMARLAFWHY